VDLKQIQDDLVELIRIERLIKLSRMTENDVLSLQNKANRGIPRAEYDCGLYALFCLKDDELAHQWFQRCKKHANGYCLWKLAMVYHMMGNQWIKESVACMRRSVWRKYPKAIRVIQKINDIKLLC
jgi:hypothetical protein